MYIDNLLGKIYFPGFRKGTHGIYIYDTKNETISDFVTKKDNDINTGLRYGQPIRIPNTQYIMYIEDVGNFEKKGNVRVIDKVAFNVWIQEIPEWKAELEAKAKEGSSEAAVKEKRYVIDGPANVWKKPKGKTIGSIENGVEVKIVSKKGDWYEVESKDMKGWTFKDNVKEVE
jgi:hypothetical protein